MEISIKSDEKPYKIEKKTYKIEENLLKIEEKPENPYKIEENCLQVEEKAISKNFIRMRSKNPSQILNGLDKKEKSELISKSPYLNFYDWEFEKAHIFKIYYPKANFDTMVRLGARNLQKAMIFKRVQTGNYMISNEIIGIIEESNEKLKNLEKYSFYPEMIRAKIARYLRKKQRNRKKKNNEIVKSKATFEETLSPNRKSVFFKRQEFKSKQTFSAFVANAVSLAKKSGKPLAKC